MKLMIKVASGSTLEVECELSHKVSELKENISTKCDVPPIQMVRRRES